MFSMAGRNFEPGHATRSGVDRTSARCETVTLQCPRRAAAFTLIELLVVLAIIALLISILAPALGRARENGRRTVCGNNLRQMGQACWNYSNDNEGWYPAKPWYGHTGAGVKELAQHQWEASPRDPEGPDGWGLLLAGMVRDILEREYTHGGAEAPKYMPDPKILVCPSDQIGNIYRTSAVVDPNTLPPQVPIRAVADIRKIKASIPPGGQQEKNYSYMYVALLRNDDRADFFLMGDESNKADIGPASLTGLSTEDNHGLRGINALFADQHVDWSPVRGGDYQSVQQMAWRLWAPAVLAPARFPASNGNRATEVETID